MSKTIKFFEKEYIGSMFVIEQKYNKNLSFGMTLYIDDEFICELDSEEVINYNIYYEIAFYIKDLFGDEITKQFSEDVNEFVRQWQP